MRVVPSTRLIAVEDAAELAELLQLNRRFLAPWDPIRADAFFTVEGQRRAIDEVLEQHLRGVSVPFVILDRDAIVGRVTLTNIVRGPFRSCNVGYWVSLADNGRGLATAAVADIARVAFTDLGLHRIEAGTLVHNVPSQRVLEHNGFIRFGLAPAYLMIAGSWQDHLMYQALNPDSN
jgi:ribosomal-protein-alanine N-acetyltransferase